MSAPAPFIQMGGDHYRRIREALGLTQSDFGSLVGAHSVTVSRWENDRVQPDRHQQSLIASFQQAIDRDAPIRPDLDAVMGSCGPVYVLYLVLHAAHGVT